MGGKGDGVTVSFCPECLADIQWRPLFGKILRCWHCGRSLKPRHDCYLEGDCLDWLEIVE